MKLDLWNISSYSFIADKNTLGYGGEDYSTLYRWIYVVIALALAIFLTYCFRKAKQKNVKVFLRIMSIILPILMIAKVGIQVYYDFKNEAFDVFNVIPLTFSAMCCIALILGAWFKGFVKDAGLSWFCTLGFINGAQNIVFPRAALSEYPLLTYGCISTLIYYCLITFIALLIVVTKYKEFRIVDSVLATALHFIVSIAACVVDYIYGVNYMGYFSADKIPVINKLVENYFSVVNGRWLCIICMAAIYMAIIVLFNFIWMIFQSGVKEQNQ